MKRDGFIFYRSFYEAAQKLPEESRLRAYEKIINYALNGREMSVDDDFVNMMFLLVKPQLDANNKRAANGSKGGRPKKQGNEEKKPMVIEKKTNGYENEKPKEKDKVKDNEKVKDKENIYRQFKHLKLTQQEFDKLKDQGYTQQQIDHILDNIENFAQNKKYNSLYLTANNWLKKEYPKKSSAKRKYREPNLLPDDADLS